MRLSPDAQHIVSGVAGVYLNGQPVPVRGGLSFGGWDCLATGIVGYGGWDTPQVGLYAASYVAPNAPFFLGPGFVAQGPQGLWSDGVSRYFERDADGSRDSDGNYWPTWFGLGSSRQGDWLAAEMPDFTRLLVRNAAGLVSPYDFGQAFTLGGMDQHQILVRLADGTIRLLGSSVVPRVPSATPIVVINSRLFWAGTSANGWLCCGWMDQSPRGYVVSRDGLDNNPAVAATSGGVPIIASGEGNAEFPQRRYEIDTANWMSRLTVNHGEPGPWLVMMRIDVLNPPQPPPTVPRFEHPIYTGSFFSRR